MDLISEIQRDLKLMQQAVEESKIRGIKLAEAERDYQIAKHTRALEMKAGGEPVTFIQMALKGDPSVRDALHARDCAQAEYDSAKEAINVYKLSARLLENQRQSEWNTAGGL